MRKEKTEGEHKNIKPIPFGKWLEKQEPKRNARNIDPLVDIANPSGLYRAMMYARHSTHLEDTTAQRLVPNTEMIDFIP